MVAKEIAVKRYVVKLSAEERERLNTLIQSGKHPARKLTRARILLKADAGEGWGRMERQPDRCGADYTLPRDCRPSSSAAWSKKGVRGRADPKAIARSSARQRIFDGATEAKLTALACSEPPKGRARWTLRLLEEKVVELNQQFSMRSSRSRGDGGESGMQQSPVN